MNTTSAAHRVRPVRRALLAAAGLLTTVALAAGCSSDAAESGSSSASGPHDGGDITFLIDSLGDTWIPNNSAISSFQGHIWGHVTDKLVYVDEKGAVSPWVAEKWEQSDDATEFTLHLKDGVTFSDGSPVDGAAVVKNLDTWAHGDPEAGINPIGLFPKSYDHSEAVDAATVKVFFNDADARLHPDPGLPRLDPDLAEDARAAGREAGRPVQRHRQRPVHGLLLEGGRQRRPRRSARTTTGARRRSATPARRTSTPSPTSWSPSRRSARPRSSPARPTSPTTPPRRSSSPSRARASPSPPRATSGSSTASRSTPRSRRSTT